MKQTLCLFLLLGILGLNPFVIEANSKLGGLDINANSTNKLVNPSLSILGNRVNKNIKINSFPSNPRSVSAYGTVDTLTTITWPFSLSTAGQTATFLDYTAKYFSSNYVGTGSNLTYSTLSTTYNITYSRFQPLVQAGSANAENLVSFMIRPKTGLDFTPTSVSFDCMRFGTDGGMIDVKWKSADGTSTTLASGVVPARNNSGAGTHVNYDLSTISIPVSNGECGLEVYIYSLGNTKQIGLANIVVSGKIKGTIVNIQTYTFSTSVSPNASGVVVSAPVGSVFDAGTSIVLTANRNFGYTFSHWTNSTGTNISTANPFTFTINKNESITAVFTPLNTYSLNLNATGGGKTYMITPSPSGTKVNNQIMYEEGTNVALVANSNPIVTFTNWLTGETTANLSILMNKNQIVTAVYSSTNYIVGWDFYSTGNSNRVADFYSNVDNEASSLIIRTADGTAGSWLDKSQLAAGGYEGSPAAVNWNALTNKYYYQISFNAKDFTNIKVAANMLFNYNAYSVQNCEYSIDGTNFTKLGAYTMSSAKVWYSNAFTLPANADHIAKVYVRWIPDYTSTLLGTASVNDGTAISAIYVTGDAVVYNDGLAPILQSSIPIAQATGVSANGKVVLKFDENITITSGTTAGLGSKFLIPTVIGKTVTFPYTGLNYNTEYTFNLDASKVADAAGNAMTGNITFKFTTIDRPTVSKRKFDFVVGVNGDFKDAIAAAALNASSGNRFYIFIPKGEYNIGTITGDANQMTTISIPNVSYIGESIDNVFLFNKSIQESINSTATISFTSTASNIYIQDISLMNKMDYRTGSLVGRGVVLWDQGDKNIYKNVKLLSNQDTYYTGGGRSYLETSEIHGTVDFICGGGDIFFNECTLYLEDRSGNCITAPATSSSWGYVFNSCIIDGFDINSGSYRLGRPWSNSPKCVYINTTMKKLPISAGWGDPMNVVPSVFAEYNSMTTSGTPIDLSSRRTTYTKDATTVTLNPILSTTDASKYTLINVLGGNDNWQPNQFTEQATAPVISGNGTLITWDNNDYVLCWAVCANGNFVDFVTSPSYTIPAGTTTGTVYTVRAANQMGGLSVPSNSFTYSNNVGINTLNKQTLEVKELQYFSIDGRRLAKPNNDVAIIIVRTIYKDGSVSVSKILSNSY